MEFDILVVLFESQQLVVEDYDRMKLVKQEFDDIRRKQETVLWQRSRDRTFLEGERNNAYFHALANHRHRKAHLFKLVGPDGVVTSTSEMLDVATSFYKTLFAFVPKSDIHLDCDFWSFMKQRGVNWKNPFLRRKSNNLSWVLMLVELMVLMVSFLLYHTFWDLIKDDFIWLVMDFENGVLDVYRLNFSIIILIPKAPHARDMKNFRTISLSNCVVRFSPKL